MANCHNCEHLFVCHSASPEEIICSSFKPKTTTNADRIRSMNDEEMAELFASWIQDCGCNDVPCREPCKKKLDANILAATPCEKNWLDWLRQEDERQEPT